MERVITVEDRIRRAEEIYNRRKDNTNNNTTKVNINKRNDFKLFKRTFIQIVICCAIYSICYVIKNNNYVFSEDFVNKAKEVLSYDIDVFKVYNQLSELFKNIEVKQEEQNPNIENNENNDEKIKDEVTEQKNEEAIGGAIDIIEQKEENNNNLSEMEQDALYIKKMISFVKPIDGTITSRFGIRNPTTNSVPKNHTGIDIANILGTKIKSATDGDVILKSSEGDYRKSSENTK